jgi:hypothetical protein
VGLPGDVIEVQKGDLFINGKSPLVVANGKSPGGTPKTGCAEEQADGRVYGICRELPLLEDYGPEKVPDHSVFVIGDGRTLSDPREGTRPGDPRAQRGWGMIPASSIRGKALWVWLSIEPRRASGSGGASELPHLRYDRMFKRVQ